MTFKEEMKERTEVIEKLLVKYLPKAEGYQSQIMEAMEYSVMAGGKRLRPMLMQETYRLFGGEGKEIEPFMAAMEMIFPKHCIRFPIQLQKSLIRHFQVFQKILKM